ncbi:MAG: DUF87 domain-containing protein [Defluviitaleaceae bacterium]|nr:DUF87 domain-containing protein [Defluviitaleaceae bacterium]
MALKQMIRELASVDIFKEAKVSELFIGRPYYLDFDKAYMLVADAWKEKVGGVPQGMFILAFYENANDNVEECLLLRALKPSRLPTDNDVIASMVEYYKDNLQTSGKANQLDDYTRYTFSFSGLECRILGTFFRNTSGIIEFGADVENFYSAHHYVAYKPCEKVLEQIANFRDGNSVSGGVADTRIGKIRYSSSLRFQESQADVPVYVTPSDFLGKRTALFGMTRTGKSNTVKKIIEATTDISLKASNICTNVGSDNNLLDVQPFEENGIPKNKVGQIIFDMNGEYANANLQDDGTAIFEKYSNITTRYSVLDKPGFRVMKINFYKEIEEGFAFICSSLAEESGDYVKDFLAIDWAEPADKRSSDYVRWARRVAAYQCCLREAGFSVPSNHLVRFAGNKEINNLMLSNKIIDPSQGLNLDDTTIFWKWVAANQSNEFFTKYRSDKGYDWVDKGLRSILSFLNQKRDLSNHSVSGFMKFRPLVKFHTAQSSASFEKDIVNRLKNGEIIIIDLSQGDPVVQKTYAERICVRIFQDAMDRFINMRPNNFVQFYFEEAHNLFPQKDDKDLSKIYNRIAKEGAKLNIGLVYATQEVSSISSNILKNTQNWFIAHLNNEDELRELRKFYDFSDFCDGLIRYSSGSDKGFVRMKTYSNAFVVPVQVDRFIAKEG